MTAPQHETTAPGAARRGALVGLYFAALVGGYALGSRGLFPFNPFPKPSSSPLARLGVALADDELVLNAGEWDALRADVDAALPAWKPGERAVLELVVAVRGLRTGGKPAWSEAEERCRTLRWPRCDRAALEALRKRSRP